MLKTTENTIPMKEFYKRLQDKLGVSHKVVAEIHKAYRLLYLDLIKEGKSINLPGLGLYELRPWPTDTVFYPKLKAMGPRTSKYRVILTQSKTVKRILRSKDGDV